MGPGQVEGPGGTIGKFDPSIRCIYTLLARHLASQENIAVLHLTWRLNATRKGAPPGTLKSPAQLLLGAEDISLAARYLRAQYAQGGGALPLVLCGFSFGGPSVMAAAALGVSSDALGDAALGAGLAPLAGVVTMGCGLRVGKRGSAELREIGLGLVGGCSIGCLGGCSR